MTKTRSPSRHATAVLLAALLVSTSAFAMGAGPAAAGTVAPPLPWEAAARMDARLLAALTGEGEHAEDPELDVIVGGPALTGPVPEADRALAMAAFAAEAAPFTNAVLAYAARTNAEVTGVYPASPAVALRIARDDVPGLAQVEHVERLTLDDERSVYLVEPVPAGSDLETMNRESVPATTAPDVWTLGYTGHGQVLAILDTGIAPDHPVFLDETCTSSRVLYWRDFVNGRPAPYDDNGHGTHVAGTAAGTAACGGRDNGLAPNATLMGVKFLDAGGGGSFADALASLQWAFDNGAHATSNSWGASSCTASTDTVRLVNNLARAGMPSAFAAGNNGRSGARTIGNPACADMAITVGATDKDMVVADYSSRGPCTDPVDGGGVERICPDVVAVGTAVTSATPSGGYATFSGTSMATPHVGGALVLMRQFKLALTGTDWDTASKAEETALKATALDLGAAGEDDSYGAGFIQIRAVHDVLANPGVPDVRDRFLAPTTDLRVGDGEPLAFRVSNAGGRAVEGRLTVTLATPDGLQTLVDRNVTLDFGAGDGHSSTFTVGSATAAGAYTYAGSFVYSWTDDDGVVHAGEILRSGSFVVRKIDVRITRDLAATAEVGSPFVVTLTVENRGNEDALNLLLEEAVRDAYAFLPGEPDAANPNWVYATPAPAKATRDHRFGRTTLGWTVDELPVGGTRTFTMTLVPVTPGTFPFVGVAKYEDGAGKSHVQGSVSVQTVTLGS